MLSLLYGSIVTFIHDYCKNHNFDCMDLWLGIDEIPLVFLWTLLQCACQLLLTHSSQILMASHNKYRFSFTSLPNRVSVSSRWLSSKKWCPFQWWLRSVASFIMWLSHVGVLYFPPAEKLSRCELRISWVILGARLGSVILPMTA